MSAYKWKTFSYNTSAEVAGAVCEELDRTVGLTPANLVDASRPEDAPLHKEFEWDDAKAAESYRREQARLMICNLTITIEKDDDEPKEVRAWYSLQPGYRTNSEPYVSTVRILSDDDQRAMLLAKAKSEMKAFRYKYSQLTELANVFKAMEEVTA